MAYQQSSSLLTPPGSTEPWLYQSPAQISIWASAQARMSGFAIGSPLFMAAFLGFGLFQKWRVERPQWRHGQGHVALTSDRIRISADGEASDIAFGLLRSIGYEGTAAVFEDVFGMVRLRVLASDPTYFSRVIEHAARPKIWQPLPLETPKSRRPVASWLEAYGIRVGVPAGWTIDQYPGRHTEAMDGEVTIGAASGPPTNGWNPWLFINQLVGPVSREQIEAVAWGFQSLAKIGNPGSEIWCPPRRLTIGGELAVTAGIRAVDPASGIRYRQIRVKIARGGMPFHVYMSAEDSAFEERWPEFETMLANWLWWDSPYPINDQKVIEGEIVHLELPESTVAAEIEASTSSTLTASNVKQSPPPEGGLITAPARPVDAVQLVRAPSEPGRLNRLLERKRPVLAPAAALIVLAVISWITYGNVASSHASSDAVSWVLFTIGFAFVAAAVKVLFAPHPGFHTQGWTRFAAAWLAGIGASFLAGEYWILVRGSHEISGSDVSFFIGWVLFSGLAAGFGVRFGWAWLSGLHHRPQGQI